MDFKQISENYAAHGQILPQHMAEIASLGFKTVINNRLTVKSRAAFGAELKAAAEVAV